MTSKELREKRAALVVQQRAIVDKARKEDRATLNTEESQLFDKIQTDVDGLLAEATRLEALEASERSITTGRGPAAALRAEADKPAEGKPDKVLLSQAFRTWAAYGASELTPEERRALNPRQATDEDGVFGRRGRGIGTAIEFRAPQTTQTGATGGFAIPEGFVAAIERSMLAFGGMLNAGTILPTASGNDLPWPTSDDTAQTGELLTENTAAAEQVISFGQIVFKAYKYSSKQVLVPTELFEDAGIDLESFIGAALGERIGRITNTHFTTGDNSAKPQGVVTASSLGKTAASATAVTVDEIIDLYHSVDPAYRINPKVGFMMKDSVLGAIRKLTKADWAGGIPIFQAGLTGGEPDTILGKRLYINQDMAAMTTGNKTILFGDFSKYMIRDISGYRLLRLTERYGEKDQVCFLLFKRFDGRMLDAGTDPVKHLIQA